MNGRCIIVGAGHAAAALAPLLRQKGWMGEIVVIGEEPYLPYHRPPLSKDYLMGKRSAESLLIRPEKVYDKRQVQFQINRRVQAIDRQNKQVITADQQRLDYDKLVLCTGASAVPIDNPQALQGVHYLRQLSDVNAIEAALEDRPKVAIVGGGYIGLEAAASLRSFDLPVSIIEAAPRVLARVTAPEVSEFFEAVHREHGVEIHCNQRVDALLGEGTALRGIRLENQSEIKAELLIVGIGVTANAALASDAGLLTENNAIVVDSHARTSDKDILALGDCCSLPSAFYQRPIRLESVQNALDQAKTAVATLVGDALPYDPIPSFWSDQYDIRLQIVGLREGYDQLLIRRYGPKQQTVFYLKNQAIIAADCINAAQDFAALRHLIKHKIRIEAAQLTDPQQPLKAWLN